MAWRRICILLFVAAVVLAAPAALMAQGGGNPIAGVEIDPQGVFRMQVEYDPHGALTRKHMTEGAAKLGADVLRPSELRKISLNRLEAAVSQRLDANQQLTDEMLFLAGLKRIKHVFYYPETKDIVIAGPAEGFARNPKGRPIGVHTGHAIMELQDLITALRSFGPTGRKTHTISVSINATQEGLARMQQFLVDISGKVGPGDAQNIARGLHQNLGLQNVTIRGVSPKTHFAQVLVEADYRMKLIGIELERPAVNIPSYVSLASPSAISRNALQRWYFTPNYKMVRVSDDRLAMELTGDGVKLIGEDELVGAGGVVGKAGKVNHASQKFVTTFTAQYPELARKSPVFAQLRNLMDMAIAAAYIQEHDFYNKAGWDMSVFGSEQALPVETYKIPKKVHSAVNVVWKGSTLVTPIGGGVSIQAGQALHSSNLLKDEEGKLKSMHKSIGVRGLSAGQWWWD